MSEVLEVLNTQPQPEMEMQRAQASALLSDREWEGYLAILDQENIATTSSRLHNQLRNEWAKPFLKALVKADEYIWPDDSARENSVWRALGDSIATHQEVRSRLLSTLIQSNDASKMFDFTQVCQMVAFGMIAGLQYATADRPAVPPQKSEWTDLDDRLPERVPAQKHEAPRCVKPQFFKVTERMPSLEFFKHDPVDGSMTSADCLVRTREDHWHIANLCLYPTAKKPFSWVDENTADDVLEVIEWALIDIESGGRPHPDTVEYEPA